MAGSGRSGWREALGCASPPSYLNVGAGDLRPKKCQSPQTACAVHGLRPDDSRTSRDPRQAGAHAPAARRVRARRELPPGWASPLSTGARTGARGAHPRPNRLEQAVRTRSGARLENRYPCKRIGGSNPLPSALPSRSRFQQSVPAQRGTPEPWTPSGPGRRESQNDDGHTIREPPPRFLPLSDIAQTAPVTSRPGRRDLGAAVDAQFGPSRV